MEYWEFLLQQEGDQHWLPLDTAQVEILEGRYRIMAHTSTPNTPVRVQVSQRLLHQDPPKRRSFKRQGQTNGDGLMVVIPFTRLQAGTWDIRCSSLPTADQPPTAALENSGEEEASRAASNWAYSVQLQVLPPGAGDDEEWTLPPDVTSQVASTLSPIATVAAAAPVPAVRPALALEQVAAALDETQADLITGDVLQGWPHRLHLTQTALLGQEGRTVDLGGHITGSQTGEPSDGLALVVRLVDPQTATAVDLTPFALASPTLPADFHLSLTIPANLETRLLLGELALVQATATTVSVLALQRFTLTVDLAALFDSIANQAEAETDYILDFAGGSGTGQTLAGEPKEEESPGRPLDLPQGPPRSVPVFTLPRDGFNLPPKLYEPSPHEISARQPTLPPFGTRRPSVQPSAPASITDSAITEPSGPRSSPSDAPVPLTEALADVAAAPSEPPPASLNLAEKDQSTGSSSVPAPPPVDVDRPSLSLPPLPTPEPPAAAAPVDQPPAVPLLVSHEVAAFRDLNLQERFWSRLNEMAVSLQQEAKERRQQPESAPPSPSEEGTASPPPEIPEPFAGEVVIYEDEDETLGQRTAPAGNPTSPTGAGDAEDPIAPPVPELDLPSGDLIAGEPVLVTLRVPFHPNRMYLKVWISDPQTRSLVDEPRQVMNLRPNGHGQLEGTVQVTAPLGCLEAAFEAITVDMITQQESYKATVSRAIVPAGLEPPVLGEFEV